MSDYHANVFYGEDDGGCVADVPDLKSCSAFGRIPEEVFREVQIAKKAWQETCRARLGLVGAGWCLTEWLSPEQDRLKSSQDCEVVLSVKRGGQFCNRQVLIEGP